MSSADIFTPSAKGEFNNILLDVWAIITCHLDRWVYFDWKIISSRIMVIITN